MKSARATAETKVKNSIKSEKANAKIKGFLSRFFRNYELGDEEDIFALGFVNSLFAMQLVLFIEREFQITIEDEDMDIDNFRTIRAMVALIERKAALNGPARKPVGI
jgi:methoxymalonate biosynthesis acyl carrier protein